MKNIFQLTLVGLALLGASPLRGGTTYQDGDVLLIFRQTGQNDVEYDIGNISQFTNHPNGYAAAVTGWDPNVATGVFGSDLTGVSVIIASTTSLTNANRTSWLSSGNPTATISDVTPTIWQGNLWSVINAIGNRPKTYLPKETFPYSLDPGGVASYDYIASGGGQNEFDLPQLGGNVNFTVEQVIPGLFGFWAIQPHATPEPAATQLGSFYIDASGNLTFIVGPPEPTIVGITQAGNVASVTFTTLPVGTYSLAYTTTLGSPVSAWTVVSGPVAGNGGNQSLTYTNTTADSAGYFEVVYSP
ncbi:MAG: hypothetical protein ABSG59_23095 [Verrucomicrobiota bacterium]|jgi:hypothetical protein